MQHRGTIGAVALALLVAAPALPASAQSALQRFEAILAEAGPADGSFAYERSVDRGDSFTLEGVTLQPDPAEETLEIDAINVNSFDFDGYDLSGQPQFLDIEVVGISIDPDTLPPEAAMLASLGEKPLKANVHLNYSMDSSGQQLNLDNLTIELQNLGSLILSLEISGVGADAMAAPPLDHFYARSYIAGRLPNTEQNLVNWIQDPQRIEPGTAMPSLGVTQDEARDIAAYLYHEPSMSDVIDR